MGITTGTWVVLYHCYLSLAPGDAAYVDRLAPRPSGEKVRAKMSLMVCVCR